MSLISHFNDPQKPIWVVIGDPYDKDGEQGYLFSSGYGYNFKKIWKLAGLNLDDCHIRSLRPCLGATYQDDTIRSNFLQELCNYKPAIIVPLDDEILNYLVPTTTQIKEKNSSMRKWAGSLLTSKFISHPHYIIGSHDPAWVTRKWNYHEIQAFIDFGHVKEEFEYFKRTGQIQPLPQRTVITEPIYDTLVDYLRWIISSYANKSINFVSSDIETIRPKPKSFYRINHHPGFPYTIALAPSPKEGISFSYWDYTPEQSVKIWRLLNEITSTIPQIGQNYFLFDSHVKKPLGFEFCLDKCQDTYFRHHILWPGLEHKLQFQTKQYTREPYYKDEGKNWNSKMKRQLMIYNVKDACVTYEIFLEQEKEFDERPHLR